MTSFPHNGAACSWRHRWLLLHQNSVCGYVAAHVNIFNFAGPNLPPHLSLSLLSATACLTVRECFSSFFFPSISCHPDLGLPGLHVHTPRMRITALPSAGDGRDCVFHVCLKQGGIKSRSRLIKFSHHLLTCEKSAVGILSLFLSAVQISLDHGVS